MLFISNLPVAGKLRDTANVILTDPIYTEPQSIKKDIPSKPLSLGTLKDFRETSVAEAEKQHFKNLMDMTNHNIKDACRISGLSRPRLYALLKKYFLT